MCSVTKESATIYLIPFLEFSLYKKKKKNLLNAYYCSIAIYIIDIIIIITIKVMLITIIIITEIKLFSPIFIKE